MDENPYASPANPYAPPAAENLPPSARSAIVTRYTHLPTEASIKSFALIYALAGLLALVTLAAGTNDPASPLLRPPIRMVPLALALPLLTTAFGLRKLRPWVKIPVGILSTLGLILFPVGTVINAHILHVVFGQKGRTVLSLPYQEIIAATPHIRHTTSKFFLAVVLACSAAMIAGFFHVLY